MIHIFIPNSKTFRSVFNFGVDELVRVDWNTPKEPCSDLLMPLLPYQKEGLGWMVHQENSESRGGILADEMGRC